VLFDWIKIKTARSSSSSFFVAPYLEAVQIHTRIAYSDYSITEMVNFLFHQLVHRLFPPHYFFHFSPLIFLLLRFTVRDILGPS